MNDKLTEIVVVVDRSGSMSSCWDDTVGGLNRFITEQQALPDDANLTLVAFDTEYDVPINAKPIGVVMPISVNDFPPRGSTALLDALGRTIDTLGARLAAFPESERPGKVVCVVVTDGAENASREYRLAQIKDKITHQQEKYGWTFIYLGANQDAFANGASYGFARANIANFDHTPDGYDAVYAASSAVVSSVRQCRRGESPKFASVQSLVDDEMGSDGGEA